MRALECLPLNIIANVQTLASGHKLIEQDHCTGLFSNHENKRPENNTEAFVYCKGLESHTVNLASHVHTRSVYHNEKSARRLCVYVCVCLCVCVCVCVCV